MGLVEAREGGLWVGAPGLGELSEALSLEPAVSWVWRQHYKPFVELSCGTWGGGWGDGDSKLVRLFCPPVPFLILK